jgi:hypothetical protein
MTVSPCLICVDRVFGPLTITDAVYDVAARPVVKGAMEGINGMPLLAFFYHLTHFVMLACHF